jgi:ABC-2 type transport system ATP-binding protein
MFGSTQAESTTFFMIKVERLTKKFAGVTAIRNLSFEVAKGEIVGFLGPNGAGKSTTMRILSSFMPATSGFASIANYDVFNESLKARAHLGYLPENVPLYGDMRVGEYLRYRGSLKGLHGKRLRHRVGTVKELCSVKEVENRLIGNLSKGYRQRVGLAEALIHEPDLLILDEPTIGLDPNQIRQVRELIKSLGERHTILLSTHILSEVEMTCTRVIIINRGTIEASDTPENLVAQIRTSGTIRLEATTGRDDPVSWIEKIPGVKNVAATDEDGWRRCSIRVEAKSDPREAIFRLAVDRQWVVRELTQERATLEDAFVELTHNDN